MPSRHDPNNPNCRFTYDWSADSATDYCTCGVSMGRSAQDDQKWDQPPPPRPEDRDDDEDAEDRFGGEGGN
jgi:hypothetical protein